MLQAGQQIGNHVTVRLLGRGGFADVYLGQHITLKLERAIKLLRNNLQDEEYQKFRREAHIIAALEHPHIVRIIDYAVWNDLPYIIMDYAPNGTMRHRHKRGSVVPPLAVLSYVRDVGDGLAFAHQKRVVHCDIKPENILIGRRGDVLVSDFGIATILQTATSSLQAAMQSGEVEEKKVVGTLPYMSPEQLRGRRVPASDQYALAVMSYEWLCGRTPFIGGSHALMFQHEHDAPSPVSRFKPDLPSALDDVLLTALEKKPGRRFPDIAHFVEAFERAVQPVRPRERRPIKHMWEAPITPPEPMHQTEKPVVANTHQSIANEPPTLLFPEMTKDTETQPVSPPVDGGEYETAPLKRKGGMSRRALLGVGAGVLVGGGALAVTNLVVPMWSAAGQGQGTAQGINVIPTTPAILTTLHVYQGHKNIVRAVTWSPDGRYIVSSGDDKTAQVWDANSFQPVYKYIEHSDTVFAIGWSPDSKNIVSGSFDETVQAWNAITGTPIFTFSDMGKPISAVSWAPKNPRIACTSLNGDQVEILDAQTGKRVVPPYHTQSNYTYAVAWSPDGTRIAIATAGIANAPIQIWDVTTNSKTITYNQHETGGVFSLAWSPDGVFIASGGADKTVHIWRPSDGQTVDINRDHSGAVFAVAWSPFDKRLIASSSEDQTIRLWPLKSTVTQHIYKEHTGGVRSIAWSPDGTRIASASDDATVHVWQAARR